MPYSPRNIRIACNHAGLTHYGGVYFFHEFLRVLQLRHFLATHLTYPRRNSRYYLSQMILALMYPIVLGLDRLETASFLRSNGTFQYLTGLPSFPDPQTLRRFLHHAPDAFWQQMHRVNDRLLQTFIHLPTQRSRLIFDLDSTVVTVFGSQEDAAVGYNPRYRGKKSYDPLLCIEAIRPTSGTPNSVPGMPVLGVAASKCWTPASPMFHQRFASCESEPTPALVSTLYSSPWKRDPQNTRWSLV
jgi:hypothetical protein